MKSTKCETNGWMIYRQQTVQGPVWVLYTNRSDIRPVWAKSLGFVQRVAQRLPHQSQAHKLSNAEQDRLIAEAYEVEAWRTVGVREARDEYEHDTGFRNPN